MAKIVSHGIEFIRLGSCRQCGACGCDKAPCPHLAIRDNLYRCQIYASRNQVCAECSDAEGEEITHKGCIQFPDNPWISVVRSGECGYWFVRADGGPMDELPFLNGEPYQLNSG